MIEVWFWYSGECYQSNMSYLVDRLGQLYIPMVSSDSCHRWILTKDKLGNYWLN